MAAYNGILVRQNLGDSGTVPRTGGWTACPDIIQAGTEPVVNPAGTFTTPTAWIQDVTKPVVKNATNYVYIRGKNLGSAAQAGIARLFAAKQSLFLYPSQWLNNPIKTQNDSDTTPIASLAPGAIGVTTDPFIWVPSDTSEHHCLVGFVSTPTISFESQQPPAGVASLDELAVWISKTGGTGWHNVQFSEAGAPTFTNKTHYPPSSTAATVRFSISCKSCPIGSQVSFSCGRPLPNGEYIKLPPVTVTTEKQIGFFVEVVVPAGWESDMYYSYYAHDKPPVDNQWSVTMSGSIVTSAQASANSLIAGLGLSSLEVFPDHIAVGSSGRLRHDMPVSTLIPVGADTTKLPA
jgi:hypothetical protein